jgi:16S rRNA (adenine1518-N6/adenine1519-N6)-dimethyltransferase
VTTADDGLPPLREVIARHGLDAKKSLGQNFLFDLNLTRRIARAAAPLAGFTIVEVGPGPGALTRALLSEGAQRIVAIERDRRAIPALEEIAAQYPGKLRIVEGDALEADWRPLVEGPVKVVANLPYNIATALLTGWLADVRWPPWFASLTLMFQKEVALRIAAPPGSEHFGRLSVLCQWRTEAKRLFDVDARAFTPPPKVTSSIVHLVPKPAMDPDCEVGKLERVTAAAFGQRRKMLRSSLKALIAGGLLEELGIDPSKRAEELPIADFARIALRLP